MWVGLGVVVGFGMIGKIVGCVDYKVLDYVFIDVWGVGYIVYCFECMMVELLFVGEVVVFYMEFLVCEDVL